MDRPQALSAEELQGRLYHSLREKGLVDSLKSQLRNKLVNELRSEGLSQSLVYHPPPSSESSLLQKAANSLVADHLQRCKYDYSLSVFVPETGNNADKLFTMKELMQLLHISPESKLYKSLITNSKDYHKRGFLWQLLTEIAQQHGFSCHTTAVQTEPCSLPPIGTIEDEFRKLDKHYASLGDEFKSKMVIEERLLSYQKQLDDRARTDIQLQCARFKENELARMRLEERENSRREIDKSRREMERTYRAKMDALTQRERTAAEKLQQAQQAYERETYTQRQSVLEEIEAVRRRESNMHRQEEINKREQSLWEDKVKMREEQAKKKEHAAFKIEIEYQQKIKDEINKYKIEEQSRYLEWNKNLEIREARVKENERRLHDELLDVQQVKDELREKRKRLGETEAELTKTRHDMISFQKQSEILGEKHREMLDYQNVKEDNVVLRRESDNLKMRIAELSRDIAVERQKHEELLREMGHINKVPTSETFMLKKQLEKLQTELRQEKAVGDHHKAQVERRYQDEVERNRELMRRYEEQTLQQRDMIKELNDMRQLLAHHKVALTNEVYRKPGHSVLDRSNSLCDIEDPSLDPGPLRAASQVELAMAEISNEKSSADEYSYSSDIVKETKRRLQGLEKEAINLEENYRNFQFRMTSVGTALEEQPPKLDTVVERTVKVTFHDDIGSSPTLAGSRHRSYIPDEVTGADGGRPLSSTPSRATSTVRQPVTATDRDLNASVSTIHSGGSPSAHKHRPEPSVRHRPMSMGDLEARPGSPSVVVMAASDASASIDKKRPSHGRGSPSGEEGTDDKTEGGVPTIPLDDAWKQQQQQQQVSLDQAWKVQQTEERLNEQQKSRDEEEEEERKRTELKRKREEEAWQKEQNTLQERENQAMESDKKMGSDETAASQDPAIDPVMQKYMDMMMQQKQKEKEQTEVVKKTIDTWNKGRQRSQDKTPSQSEDISAGADTEDDKSVGKPDAEEDFWTP